MEEVTVARRGKSVRLAGDFVATVHELGGGVDPRRAAERQARIGAIATQPHVSGADRAPHVHR